MVNIPKVPEIARLQCLYKSQTRSPGTTSVCFSVVTVNDEYRKPEFKIRRRGYI